MEKTRTNRKTSSEIQLIKSAKVDAVAREVLFYKYEKMIYKIIGKYSNAGVDFDDLKSEAIIGFYHALSKFDISKKVKFSTYSTYWIKERVLLLIKNNNRKVGIAYNKLNSIQKMKNIEKEIEELELTEIERDLIICEKLDISKEKLHELRTLSQPVISIDNSVVVDIDSPTAEEDFEMKYTKDSIRAALLELDELERQIIILFYFQNKSYKEIKQSTHYSYSEIKGFIKSGLDKMKLLLMELGIDSY